MGFKSKWGLFVPSNFSAGYLGFVFNICAAQYKYLDNVRAQEAISGLKLMV